MEAVQVTVSLGHALRKEHKLKVRQPLPAAHLASSNPLILSFLEDQQHLIAEELNVKKVLFSTNEREFVSLQAKPNFRVLGKKVGKLMRAAQVAIEKIGQEDLQTLLDGGVITIDIEGSSMTLTSEDVQVERAVHEGVIAANQGLITIALDTNLSEELLLEGLAREIVNKVNTMRREADFAVTDRIKLQMEASDRVKAAFELFREYICQEVLAVDVVFGSTTGTEWDLNGEQTVISIEKEVGWLL